MPRYAILLDQHEDLVVEDDNLVLDLGSSWATFSDHRGIALAIPIARICSIQRLDEAGTEGGDPDGGQDR